MSKNNLNFNEFYYNYSFYLETLTIIFNIFLACMIVADKRIQWIQKLLKFKAYKKLYYYINIESLEFFI
jgi:hypothetical protein